MDSRNLFEYTIGNPLVNLDHKGLHIPNPYQECETKFAAYQAAYGLLYGASHWQELLSDWYYEKTDANPRYFIGSHLPWNKDIASNSGFQALVKAWAAKKFHGVELRPASIFGDGPAWSVDVNSDTIFWRFYFPDFDAGGLSAYTQATFFLGSYSAKLNWTYGSNCKINVRVKVTNQTSWTSASKTLKSFGGKWANLPDSKRRDDSRWCRHGGNFTQHYLFQVNDVLLESTGFGFVRLRHETDSFGSG